MVTKGKTNGDDNNNNLEPNAIKMKIDILKPENLSKGDERVSSDSTLCPLFMDGLPSDFTNNPSLAAIASLLEEDDNDDTKTKYKENRNDEPKKGQVGGGKLSRKKKSSRNTPYFKDEKKNKTSMGEAQLFMKMWKI